MCFQEYVHYTIRVYWSTYNSLEATLSNLARKGGGASESIVMRTCYTAIVGMSVWGGLLLQPSLRIGRRRRKRDGHARAINSSVSFCPYSYVELP